MPTHLAPFDPARSFVAMRNFRYQALIYQRGDPFPAVGAPEVPERKYQQLYETRFIRYADEETPQVRTTVIMPPSERARVERLDDPERQLEVEAELSAEQLEEQAQKLADSMTRPKLEALDKGGTIEGLDKLPNKLEVAKALIKAGLGGGDGTA